MSQAKLPDVPDDDATQLSGAAIRAIIYGPGHNPPPHIELHQHTVVLLLLLLDCTTAAAR